jgi:Mn2+/Fe2+ NRAMP family transporter
VQADQSSEESKEAVRRRRFRRTVVMLLLAIVLILLALLIYATGQPDWQVDGSREPYPSWTRALICASLVAGTLLGPLGVRELVLAILPSKALGVVLGIVIGLAGAVVVPIELWLAMGITDGLDAGTKQRYESDEASGSSFDWD